MEWHSESLCDQLSQSTLLVPKFLISSLRLGDVCLQSESIIAGTTEAV